MFILRIMWKNQTKEPFINVNFEKVVLFGYVISI